MSTSHVLAAGWVSMDWFERSFVISAVAGVLVFSALVAWLATLG
jgi:hypothetical protein